MKPSLYILIPAMLAIAACGSTASLSSGQRFNDGIYYAHEKEMPVSTAADDKKVNDLVERTRTSEIYLFGDEKTDTVVIPDNKANSTTNRPFFMILLFWLYSSTQM